MVSGAIRIRLFVAAAFVGACGGATPEPPIGVSQAVSTPRTPANTQPVVVPAAAAPAEPKAWSDGLDEVHGAWSTTHRIGDTSAGWAVWSNAAARPLLDGKSRTAPNGAELVARIESKTAGTAWLRMRKLEGKWAYEAKEGDNAAPPSAMASCAPCHAQASTDSVYFSPTK